jgi:hypothetical protein
MCKKLILNKGDKRILKKYLKYYAEKLQLGNNSYKLSNDYIDDTDDEYKMYHIGMSWMVGQMQHELSFIKTIGEQQEIDRKWDLIKDRVINK